jgi:hypothetical protein
MFQFTAAVFAIYPVAALFRVLPSQSGKHLLSCVVGLLLLQWLYQEEWIHPVVTTAATYFFCKYAPSKHVAVWVFALIMGHMVSYHVYRMYVSYLGGAFDIGRTQMVITMKLTSFAYNYYDGTYDKANVFAERTNTSDRKFRVMADRKKYAVTKLPSLLEFTGYVFCFPCLLVGPAFEYNDYIRAIDGSAFVSDVPAIINSGTNNHDKSKVAVNEKSEDRQYFGSFWIGARYLLLSIAMLIAHVAVSARYPIKNLFSEAWLAQPRSYANHFAYLLAAILGERFKFYFVWKIAEGACIMAGFGFQGFDRNGQVIGWQGVENVDIILVETATNVQQLSRAWNKRTQGWLERYTYHRTGGNVVLLYFVSALWHGLYPGYFIAFMTVPLLTTTERLARLKLTPYFGGEGDLKSTVYSVVCWTATIFSLSYTFQVRGCKSVFYFGCVLITELSRSFSWALSNAA